MSTKTIQITEPNGPRGHAISHDGSVYYEGETRTVDATVAALFCSLGWAIDPDGELQTGERSTEPRAVDVNSAQLKVG